VFDFDFAGNRFFIDKGAVGAAEILDPGLIVFLDDDAVLDAYQRTGRSQLALGIPTDVEFRNADGNPLPFHGPFRQDHKANLHGEDYTFEVRSAFLKSGSAG
jgi:hypothetical protein